MKLTSDKTTELKKLSGYFSKIEKLASTLDIDVDDLMNEYKNHGAAVYDNFKEKLLSKASDRADAFKKSGTRSSEKITRR